VGSWIFTRKSFILFDHKDVGYECLIEQIQANFNILPTIILNSELIYELNCGWMSQPMSSGLCLSAYNFWPIYFTSIDAYHATRRLGANMQNIPHVNYYAKRISSKNILFIEVDGQVMHKIDRFDDIEKFYRLFGYASEMANSGILPDEFIWNEYLEGAAAKYSACYRMHIVEYLNNYSPSFRNKYGEQCEKWIAAHANTKVAGDELCFFCRMKPFCSKRMSTENLEVEMFAETHREIVANVLEKKRLNPFYKPTQEENNVINAVCCR